MTYSHMKILWLWQYTVVKVLERGMPSIANVFTRGLRDANAGKAELFVHSSLRRPVSQPASQPVKFLNRRTVVKRSTYSKRHGIFTGQ